MHPLSATGKKSATKKRAKAGQVVVLGTGGTIAGVAPDPQAVVDYRAGELSTQALVQAVPSLAGANIRCENLAQIDSCDMEHAIWLALQRRCVQLMAEPSVAGVVITHGTDTLEESAYFLHRTVRATKPVVFTAAMRPATAVSADGPQNLLDAVHLAALPGVHGVMLAFAGKVYGGADVRKVHGFRLEAFEPGDAGLLALMEQGLLRPLRAWPKQALHPAAAQLEEAANWPVVDIVMSHAGARPQTLAALVRAGAQGIVIAGTGNGSVHHGLLKAARKAQAAGVVLRRASRCQLGGVVDAQAALPDELPSAGRLTAPQARIELMLDLMLGATRR